MGKETEKYLDDNVILKAEAEYKNKKGPSFYPALVINGRTYMGSLDPENVFNAICQGFKDKPHECLNKSFGPMHTPEVVTTLNLLMIIAGLIVINVALILCYRKWAKREQSREMRTQITSAVAQYMALRDNDHNSIGQPDVE